MSGIGTELLFLLVLVACNGLLAMSELAIVSARKLRLQQRAEAGDVGARRALALANEPTRFLSTIQIGITAVGILAGAFGGATLSRELEYWFGTVPPLAPYREPLSFGLVVVGITYLSLIIGELVPKQIALTNAERIAARIARPMELLSAVAAPAVWVVSASANAVLGLIRVRPTKEALVSEDEVKLLIQHGTHSGVFEPAEQALLEGALGLGDQRVAELMTPRPRVVWLDVEDPPEENWKKVAGSSHTCFPVCQGDLSDLLGIVSIRLLWERLARGEPVDLRGLPLFPPTFVVDQNSALKLLEVFQSSEGQLVLVIDEHGQVVGVVTQTDLMEAVVGDAMLFGKRRELRPLQRPDGSWLLDGLLGLDAVKKHLAVNELPGGEEMRYRTLGGLIFSELGRAPRLGDALDWDGWCLEVVEMDGLRIDKVLATPQGADSPAGGSGSPGTGQRERSTAA